MALEPEMTADPRDRAIADLRDWIVKQGIEGTPFDVFLETLCLRLVEAGLPLLRLNITMRMHHPTVGDFAYRWKRASGRTREE